MNKFVLCLLVRKLLGYPFRSMFFCSCVSFAQALRRSMCCIDAFAHKSGGICTDNANDKFYFSSPNSANARIAFQS